ncbi:hypothetical protein TNCV_93241 [Trichonephila clavipes]|nr:hypothetical protein TNCV_93241 [Trichonephila clavipes]
MKASSILSPGEDSTRITLSGTFRLTTEKNTPPFLGCPRLMFSAAPANSKFGERKVQSTEGDRVALSISETTPLNSMGHFHAPSSPLIGECNRFATGILAVVSLHWCVGTMGLHARLPLRNGLVPSIWRRKLVLSYFH